MRRILLCLACLFSLGLQALEYTPQFENDQICIVKAKIEPNEELGLHRDVYPQVVIALKGGTITRLETNGQETDVQFPTGVAVFRPTDPEGVLHRSVNKSFKPVELMIIQLKDNFLSMEKQPNSSDISVDIRISCPVSDEFQDFVNSIPSGGSRNSSSFDEWKSSFVNNMYRLIRLVESGKVFNSQLGIKVDDSLLQESNAKIDHPQ